MTIKKNLIFLPIIYVLLHQACLQGGMAPYEGVRNRPHLLSAIKMFFGPEDLEDRLYLLNQNLTNILESLRTVNKSGRKIPEDIATKVQDYCDEINELRIFYNYDIFDKAIYSFHHDSSNLKSIVSILFDKKNWLNAHPDKYQRDEPLNSSAERHEVTVHNQEVATRIFKSLREIQTNLPVRPEKPIDQEACFVMGLALEVAAFASLGKIFPSFFKNEKVFDSLSGKIFNAKERIAYYNKAVSLKKEGLDIKVDKLRGALKKASKKFK